jgi:ubiquinone biosynthesis protein
MEAERVKFWRVAPRLREIWLVLARHKVLGALRGPRHLPPPEAVLAAIQELGVTFIKFGQVLALRCDLLPDEYTDVLKQLHDQCPVMAFDDTRSAVEAQLGSPLEQVFSSFSERPLAAASIALVYEATLCDGRHVAVKIQRPGLKAVISKDIEVFTYLTTSAERWFPRLRGLGLVDAVGEFSKSLNRELDFRREGRSMQRICSALSDVPDICVPYVVAEYSTAAMLTLEFMVGERLDLYAVGHREEMPHVIDSLVSSTLQTLFEYGLFHADAHPGNVLIVPDGRLCLLDFGNTGQIDEATRESLALLLEAIVKGDARAAVDAYLDMSAAHEGVDRAGLLSDMRDAIYDLGRSDEGDIKIGDTFESLLRVGTRRGVRNSPEIILMTRAFVILESLTSSLSPDHNWVESFRLEVSRMTAQRYSFEGLKRRTIHSARELERLAFDAPGDARRLFRRVSEGDLGRVESPSLEALGGRVIRTIGRLTSVIGAGALVIGGAMLSTAPGTGWHHPLGEDVFIFGLLSMSVILIATIFSSRTQR